VDFFLSVAGCPKVSGGHLEHWELVSPGWSKRQKYMLIKDLTKQKPNAINVHQKKCF